MSFSELRQEVFPGVIEGGVSGSAGKRKVDKETWWWNRVQRERWTLRWKRLVGVKRVKRKGRRS